MSMWYAAHLLMYVRRKNKSAGKIPVRENIVLIQADSDDDAFKKAAARGQRDAGDDDGTFRWEGEPAEWVFAGVRKLTLCDDAHKRPADGTEVSYNEMEVSSIEALQSLLDGKSTNVKLSDFFRDSEGPSKPVAVKHGA
jgi:hypothetical protein